MTVVVHSAHLEDARDADQPSLFLDAVVGVMAPFLSAAAISRKPS